MTPSEELKMWKNTQKALIEVPKDHRSANHYHYLNEINGRVREGEELLKYAKTRKDE